MVWQFAPLLLLIAQAPAADAPAVAPAVAPAPAQAAPAAQPSGNIAAPAVKPPANAPQPVAAQPESILPMLITFAPLLLLFYFMAIRPTQQQEKKRRQMVEALKKNDKVLTSAGIYGTVTSVDPTSDKVVIRVDDEKQTRMTFTKGSIARVIEPTTEKATESSS